MKAVPEMTPAAMPLDKPIGATEGAELDHVPPMVALLSVVELPWHTVKVPVIGVRTFTVITATAVQPAGVV